MESNKPWPQNILSLPLNFIGSFKEVAGTWTKVFYKTIKRIFKLK